MHDTFLNHRIYEALIKLCQENEIRRLKKVHITVDFDSHISEASLREHFYERHNPLLGEWTEVIVENESVGRLQAIIRSIEGESPDE